MNGTGGTSNQFSESDEAELAVMLATELQEAEQAWRGFDLTARVKELEEQKALAAKNQTESIIRRRKIAEQTKNFKALSQEDQLKSIGQLVRSYQTEIDLLSKRSQAAETTLTELSSRISGINDPSTVFAAVNQELAKASGSSLLAPSFSTSWAVLTGRGGGGGDVSGAFLDESFSIPTPASSSSQNGGNMVSEEAHNNLKEKIRVLEIDFKTERKEKEEMEKRAANELAKLQVELIENKKKLEEATTQNVELKSKTARAGTSIKQLQAKTKELTDGLQTSQKEKEEFKKKAEEMMQKHDEMLDEVEGKSRRIAGLKTELEKAQKNFEELREERDALAKTILNLKLEKETLSKQDMGLAVELERYIEHSSELTTKVEGLMKDVERMTVERDAALREVERQNQEIADRGDENARLKEEVSRVTSDIDGGKAKQRKMMAQIRDLTERNTELVRIIDELKSQNQDLAEDLKKKSLELVEVANRESQKAGEEAHRGAVVVKALEAQVADFKLQIETMLREGNERESNLRTEHARIALENDSLKRRNQDLDETNEKLSQTNKSLSNDLEQATTRNENLTNEFVGEFQQLKAKNEQLQEELNVQNRKKSEMLSRQEQNSKLLTIRVEELQEEVQTLTSRLKDSEEALKKAKMNIEELQATIETKQQEILSIRGTTEKLQQQHSQRGLQEQQRTTEALEQQQQLLTKLDKEVKKCDLLSKENAELREELTTAKATIANISTSSLSGSSSPSSSTSGVLAPVPSGSILVAEAEVMPSVYCVPPMLSYYARKLLPGAGSMRREE